MKLVIVESPSKTKTIKQYLGPEYEVVASKGHVRDIADTGKGRLGLDFNNNLKPIYEIIPAQQPTIKMLNEKVEKADVIYLATDPDREGEAISWHLKEVLHIGNKPVYRIEFNEITEPAIKEAMKTPRNIDMLLVSSQETRKIIDRVIGFRLSSLLKKTVGAASSTSKVSAGRVQSAALKMVTDKEEEIQKFVPEQFFEIEATNSSYTAKLQEPETNKVFLIKNKEEAQNIYASLSPLMTVTNINVKKQLDRSYPPFTTSTLIQSALNKYSINSKRTMMIAQTLYEGIDIDGKNVALITYMRTDSTRMSDVFKNQLVPFIKKNYGDEYLGYAHMQKDTEGVQDAHEAIRPVSLAMAPDSLRNYLKKDQLQIYTLIYQRTIASMMKDATKEITNVTFRSNNYLFMSSFEKYSFLGWHKAFSDKKEEKVFEGKEGSTVEFDKISLNAKETQPPERYTESTLIREMETSGIGRPSTYASTMDTLVGRRYISEEKKKIIPSKQGLLVSEFLHKYFSAIINIEYTAKMEDELDEIAKGKEKEATYVHQFYDNFEKIYEDNKEVIKPIPTGELCPVCGSPMVFKTGKFGQFEACSNYPSCTYIKKTKKDPDLPHIECPKCHEGYLVLKTATKGPKKGKKFYGCSQYPKCDYITTVIPSIKEAK